MKEKGVKRISPDLRILLVYLLIWLIPIIVFWCFIYALGAMLYSIVFQIGWYLFFAFIISYIVGRKNYWSVWKWVSPLFIGVLNALCWNLTFDIIGNHTFSEIQFASVRQNTVAAAIGLLLGVTVRVIANKIKRS